jgi:hypothetical protein
MQIQMNKNVTLAYCEICENLTPLVEVYHSDLLKDESWSEQECKYCFDSQLEWEERYG